MRVAFVSIPHFACAVEVLRDPRLAGLAVVVGDDEQPRRVFDCSEAAARSSIYAGMPIRAALATCPEVVIVPPDPVRYRSLWESTLDAVSSISPVVEDAGPGHAYLDVAGLERLYSDEPAIAEEIVRVVRDASDLEAAVGIAGGKFPAYAAALSGSVIALGDEPATLASLPVDLLPVDAEVIRRLRLLGLDCIGEVAVLTVSELQSQFGAPGRRIWELVNGLDKEPLWPRPPVELLSTGISFDAPVAGIDVMVAGARQLFSRLQPALRGRALRELTLQAELSSGRGWERHLVFREAVSECDRLTYLLRSTLQNAPPPMAVHSLTLRLSGLTGETGKQLSLGERGRLQSQVEEAIRQLKARYGYSPIYRCVDVKPWSVLPEERQILVESDS